MSVKRYDLVGDMDGNCNLNEARMELSDDGVYVKYSEHLLLKQKLTDMAVQLANAESKCRELAAELSAVDKIHNEAVYITDEHYEQCPPEVQKMIHSLAVLQIPAYQAFLAEVRAQGVDAAIKHLSKKFEGTGHLGVPIMALEWLAQELRKGAAL